MPQRHMYPTVQFQVSNLGICIDMGQWQHTFSRISCIRLLCVRDSISAQYAFDSSNGLAVKFGIYFPINSSGFIIWLGIDRSRIRRKDSTPDRSRLLWKGTLTFNGIVALLRFWTSGCGLAIVCVKADWMIVCSWGWLLPDARSLASNLIGWTASSSRTPAKQSRLRTYLKM